MLPRPFVGVDAEALDYNEQYEKEALFVDLAAEKVLCYADLEEEHGQTLQEDLLEIEHFVECRRSHDLKDQVYGLDEKVTDDLIVDAACPIDRDQNWRSTFCKHFEVYQVRLARAAPGSHINVREVKSHDLLAKEYDEYEDNHCHSVCYLYSDI